MDDTRDVEEGFTRRDFLGSAALTTAGAAVGLSNHYRTRYEQADYSADKNDPVRLGYIGVGRRGGALLRSSVLVPGSQPIAVADVQEGARQDAVKDIKKHHKDVTVDTYDDYRRLLDNPEVEAVFIATPHYLHGPMALDAIQAGKHVYCEKAMAFTIGENQDIYNLVQAENADGPRLVFQVGHQRHYSPLYRKVKELVAGDRIGDVAAIRAQWNRNDQVRRPCQDLAMERIINWRLYSEYSGGLTTEFASHQIDVANWLLGTHPDSVCGFGGNDWYEDGRDTEDNIHLIFNYKVPILKRDPYGRPEKDGQDNPVYVTNGGKIARRNVCFDYMSIMENAHLGPSELILGQYGTLEVALMGAEFFKEKKARLDPNRVVEGTDPRRAHQKRVLRTGSTVDPTAAGLPRKKGAPLKPDHDPTHWVEFVDTVKGSYDKHETLLATASFMTAIRLARKGESFDHELKADVEIGLWGAVPALMANMAMREERTVYWNEFFPGDEETVRMPGKPGKAKQG